MNENFHYFSSHVVGFSFLECLALAKANNCGDLTLPRDALRLCSGHLVEVGTMLVSGSASESTNIFMKQVQLKLKLYHSTLEIIS